MKKRRPNKETKLSKKRFAKFERKTRETDITVKVEIDGSGESKISTGIGFLDHMLELFAKHGLFDIEIRAKGDLAVDSHHTNEDTAICLGQAFSKALGDKKGIRRFGFFYVPMGDALARVVLDLSSRTSFKWNQARLTQAERDISPPESGYAIEDARHFLESFASEIKAELWVDFVAARDVHHTLEAIFKALSKALGQATQIDPRVKGIPSTKGKLG
ncbi:MAG: imidazoleglycerol-phosphate dehydratase [Candidatus Omnitrophica bacterium]|nr:imidazoleglycerol-phosphate dehydratase [Candidatus Omnitrophota bacterium]